MSLPHFGGLKPKRSMSFGEVVAHFQPVALYSIGKDSLYAALAMKAFYPAKPPFPFLHVIPNGSSGR